MIPETVDLCGAPVVALSSRAIAIVKTLLTWGTLATRLLVAGTLLMVGLPALTTLAYILGYPSTPVHPLVYLVDGLQALIVLNALVVVAQLVAWSRIWVPGRRAQTVAAGEAPLPVQRSGPMVLQELCRDLIEMIWAEEQKSSAVLGPAVLDYVRDEVTAEVERRRRWEALEQRLAQIELLLRPEAGAEAAERDRR
jgi:hypothetical protein